LGKSRFSKGITTNKLASELLGDVGIFGESRPDRDPIHAAGGLDLTVGNDDSAACRPSLCAYGEFGEDRGIAFGLDRVVNVCHISESS
jgi:hypothetical protein